MIFFHYSKNQAAKPVVFMVASRPTGERRPDARYPRGRRKETGLYPSWLKATSVFGRARSAHAVGSDAATQSARRALLRCNRSATRVERVEFVDSMDA